MPEKFVRVRSKDGLKIFCLRSGFLGDILMSTAAIRAVRQSYPDATIAYASWDVAHSLLNKNPNIDHVFPVGAYRLVDFDVLIDIRHEKLMHEHWLEHGEYPSCYWGELHFEQFKRKLPELKVPSDFRPDIYIEPSDYQVDRASDKPLVVINAWSRNGINWRLWNLNKWSRLVKLLQDQGYVVVQLSGKGDPAIEGVDSALALPLRKAVGVMVHADLAIGIDSFVMHAAGSRIIDSETQEVIKDGVPGVILCGPIASSNVVPVGSPVTPFKLAETLCPDGVPCGTSFSTDVLPICKHGNACMRDLEVDELWQFLKPLLKHSLMISEPLTISG